MWALTTSIALGVLAITLLLGAGDILRHIIPDSPSARIERDGPLDG
jgi:hypothetical protein